MNPSTKNNQFQSQDQIKFTIEGFSQRILVENGLDATDAVLLRWFIDWFASGDMDTVVVEGREYALLKYQKVIRTLPILSINTSKQIGRRLKKLADAGILSVYSEKVHNGTNQYYRPGKTYASLIEGRTDSRAEADKEAQNNPRASNVPWPRASNVPSYSSSSDSSSKQAASSNEPIVEEVPEDAVPAAESSDDEEIEDALDILETYGVKKEFARENVRSAAERGIHDFGAFYEYLHHKRPDAGVKLICRMLTDEDKIDEFLAQSKPEPDHERCPVCGKPDITGGNCCYYCYFGFYTDETPLRYAADMQDQLRLKKPEVFEMWQATLEQEGLLEPANSEREAV